MRAPRTLALFLVSLAANPWGCDKGQGSQPPPSNDGAAPGPGGHGPRRDVGTPADDGSADGPADTPEPAGDDGDEAAARTPLVDQENPHYERLEGKGFDNACGSDANCFEGGCSGEVCSASKEVTTTCEVVPVQLPGDASCGCVDGQCQWWSPSGAKMTGGTPSTTPPPANDGTAAQAGKLMRCGKETCKPGQVCKEYYGIAGPSGPKFQSCEWTCKGGCPKGTKCVTVADGPGEVCR